MPSQPAWPMIGVSVGTGGYSGVSVGGLWTGGGNASANAWRELVETLRTVGLALAIALVLRVVIFQPFTIPSSSMEPGLVTGDYIVVSKSSYGWSRASLPFNPPLFKGRLLGRAAQRGDVGAGAHRVGDHRPHVGHDVQVDAGAAQRDDDVGEQDRRVHPVAAHRLQRDLADQFGVEAGLHHGVPGAQHPVFGQ